MRLAILAFAAVTCLIHAGRASGASGDKSTGCGVGWYIADKYSLLSSSIRNTTHAVVPPTFSMTSGTSGCAPHSIVLKERRSEHFVEANYDRLREDAARGEGEFLKAFLDTMSCDAAGRPAAYKLIQGNFDAIFAEDLQPPTIVERTRMLMMVTEPATGSCTAA